MASGRMVHKSIFVNVELGELEIPVRYFFTGLIVNSDDDGRMKADAKFLKATIFPFDFGLRIETIEDMLQKLNDAKLISLYLVEGKRYLFLPNWNKWQSIRKDRYNPSDCPKPLETNNDNQMATKWQPDGNHPHTQPNLTQPNLSNSAKGTNIPPTVEEVTKYCKERNNSVEPQRFIDFYSAKGWVIGKNRMKNWMAAVRTWERVDEKPKGGWGGKPAF